MSIESGVDAAAFDPDSRRIFASNGDGTLNIFQEKSPNEYETLAPCRLTPARRPWLSTNRQKDKESLPQLLSFRNWLKQR